MHLFDIFNISIHAPLRERLRVLLSLNWKVAFQSTLPCGSDVALYKQNLRNAISIHAPLRERRAADEDHCQTRRISIHAPLRERPFIIKLAKIRKNISIHAPLRERRCQRGDFSNVSRISIHAPLRERHNLPLCSCLPLRFQSTLPCGSDTSLPELRQWLLKFQSTLPCGSDMMLKCILL